MRRHLVKDAERKQIVRQLRAETDAIIQRDTSLSRRLAEVNRRDVEALRAATPREDNPSTPDEKP